MKTYLSALLVIQLLFAGGIYWHHQAREAALTQQKKLVVFDKDAIDRLQILDGTQKSVTLEKSDAEWRVADLPADKRKIEELLARLHKLEVGWPVTTGASSHDRFKVGADKFQSSLRLYQGDQLVHELLLGSSSGLRDGYTRRAGEDEVYMTDLMSYEFSVDVDRWLDQALLAPTAVKSVSGPGYSLSRADSWLLHASGEQKEADSSKAQALFKALEQLRVTSLADKAPSKQPVAISVVADEGKQNYRFYQDGEAYYVSREDLGKVFKISKKTYEDIAGVSAADLEAKEKASSDTQPEPDSSPQVESGE